MEAMNQAQGFASPGDWLHTILALLDEVERIRADRGPENPDARGSVRDLLEPRITFLNRRPASSDGEATTSSRFDQAARLYPSRDGDELSRSATCREVFAGPRLDAVDSRRPRRTLAATRPVDR
jgi:hypothetical protein